MRLVLFDLQGPDRCHFFPLALSRPVFDLRCGMTSLGQRLIAACAAESLAFFMPPYMAAAFRERTRLPVNDPASFEGDDLLLLSGHLKAAALNRVERAGPSRIGIAPDGQVHYLWLRAADASRVRRDSLESLFDSAKAALDCQTIDLPVWNYIWDVMLASPALIAEDFKSLGRSGIEGTVEQPSAIRGSKTDVFIAPTAHVHPMVVIDAEHGPVYLDEGVEVHPFTRIEGPCYVGQNSILLGAKCREGNSIGPMCRVGGEIEESVIHGYSNKYHDGFLGHAYVGEWVNLGALTTNSDLKNDYGSVEVVLDGRRPINTGSVKVGSLVGDHTKTSIGTLLNTGSYVGGMSLIMATGKPLPKHIPEFSWLIDGAITRGFGKNKLYETARIAMGRRRIQWTPAQEAMWDAVFDLTAPQRDEAVRRGRRQLLHK